MDLLTSVDLICAGLAVHLTRLDQFYPVERGPTKFGAVRRQKSMVKRLRTSAKKIKN